MTAMIVPMDKIRAARQLAQSINHTIQIGRRIAAARTAAGLSNADLSRLTGLPSSQISQWERGVHRPSLAATALALPFLEVSLDYIFLGDMRGFPWEKMTALQNAYEQVLAEEPQDAEDIAQRRGKRRLR